MPFATQSQTQQSYSHLFLFGGDYLWRPDQFTASDDRVRGGSSISHLTVAPSADSALFHGHLDTHALGGAGFASQRTAGVLALDLAMYSGLELVVDTADSDGRRYAVTLKDELPEVRSDGREASGVSWEAAFSIGGEREEREGRKGVEKLYFAWEMFRPTYRGREWLDVKFLKTGNLKRISFLMRSFFGEQEGDFRLRIQSLAAVKFRENDSRTTRSGEGETVGKDLGN